MPERVKEFLPFMVGAIVAVPGAKVNINRIVEAVIIAAITGAISVYGVTQVLTTQMAATNDKISVMDKSNTEAFALLRGDIQAVRVENTDTRRILYDHLINDNDRFKRVAKKGTL